MRPLMILAVMHQALFKHTNKIVLERYRINLHTVDSVICLLNPMLSNSNACFWIVCRIRSVSYRIYLDIPVHKHKMYFK